MKTNVLAPILCAKHAMLRMSPKHGGQGGSIVNVSSVAARLGSPDEYVDYAASKGALDTFTIGLSKEVAGEGIRVNAVRPGYIYYRFPCAERRSVIGSANWSRRYPWPVAGRPDEVAEAIVWLLSDKASYATGTFVDLGGGRGAVDSVDRASLPQLDRVRPHVGASLLAIASFQATSELQKDLTIRPNVSIAFSAASFHGLP